MLSSFVIISGHRKSGTSVFHSLFDGHPDIYVYPIDISVLYAYFPYYTVKYDRMPNKLRERLKLVLSSCFKKCDIDFKKSFNLDATKFVDAVLNDLDDSELYSKESVLTSIANNWIQYFYKSDLKKPFLFKETSQSVFIHEFLSFSEKIKFISLIRDPRDNYAAIKAGVKDYYSQMNESEMVSLASVINRARMDLISAMIGQKEYPNDFLAIRFEDLVNETDEIMQNVANFLNIKFDKGLLTPTKFGIAYKGNSLEGKVFSGLSDKNIGEWPSRISNEEAQIIEYWMHDAMRHWNYELKFPLIESQEKYSEFYNWYNAKFFYSDSFKSASQ